MSGVVKGVKKVFKKVGKFVKKYGKYILMAAAVYFTAGVALSAFAATAPLAAAMPGFAAGGMFSQAAVGLGFSGAAGSGIAATASAATASAAAASAAAAGNFGAYGTIMSGGAASAGTVAAGTGSLSAAALAAGTTTVAPVVTKGFFASMSAFEKIQMLKMGVDTASGLLAKKPEDFPAPNQFSGRDSQGRGPGLGVSFNRETGNIDMAADTGGGKAAPAEPMKASARSEASASTTMPEPNEVEGPKTGSQDFLAANGPNSAPQDLNAQTDAEEEQSSFISQGYRTGNYSGMA